MNGYKLSNGVKIPSIGLGTWLIENDKAANAVRSAIKLGYTHIDTAQGYGNERGVGQGIKESGIKREDIFIQTKILAETKNYAEAKKSIDESLSRLGVDYIDLMIIHAPKPWSEMGGNGYDYKKENLEVYRALEDAYNEGKLKAIGVSNFSISDLENIVQNARIKPMVNQIHMHIYRTNYDMIEYCKKNDIIIEAYSPLAHGDMLSNGVIKEYADKYNVSTSRLMLRYLLNLGCVVLPKSTHEEYQREDLDVDFEISEEDMKKLYELHW